MTALGVNCTAPALVLPILEVINKTLKENNCSDKVVVVYPNSGERYIARKLKDGEEEHWHTMATHCMMIRLKMHV